MDSQSFKPLIEKYHKQWLCEMLNLRPSVNGGIDITGGNFRGELKSKMRNKGNSFSVATYQIRDFEMANRNMLFMGRDEGLYSQNICLFFAFLHYDLKKPVSGVAKKEPLDRLIEAREVWLVPWEFVKCKLKPEEKRRYIAVGCNEIKRSFNFAFHPRNGGVIYVVQDSLLERRLLDSS